MKVSNMAHDEKTGISYFLTYEDVRYPLLIVQGKFGNVGYSLDLETGELRRVCICAARSNNECVCGAWDEN